MAQARDPLSKKAMGTLQSPSLIGVIEVHFAIVGHRLTIAVDSNSRVVILGVRGPVERRIYLFGVANDDSAVMLEGRVSSPKRANPRAAFFEIGRYMS